MNSLLKILCLAGAVLASIQARATEDLAQSLKSLANEGLSASQCVRVLSAWNQNAAALDPRNVFSSTASAKARQTAAELQDQLFRTRLALRERVAKFTPAERRACLSPLRATTNHLRTWEELAFEWRVRHGGLAKIQSPSGRAPRAFDPRWTSHHPEFANWRFQPGDIIIERGTNYMSAFISRITDDPHLFSHLVLIGQDASGRLYAVESEGNTDARTTPLNEWLTSIAEDAGARFALYRFHDAGTAAKAARFAYENVSARQRAGDPIRYDFHVNEKDRSELFCTEIATWAFEHASRGRVRIPEFESTIHRTRRAPLQVLNKMEIWARQFFQPGDIDLDPRFTLIAEYRDFTKLRNVREADAISDAMIRWSTALGYELEEDPLLAAGTHIAVGLRQVITGLPFSDRTPPGLAEVVVQTQGIGEAIQQTIAQQNESRIRKTGSSMTPQQLRAALETLRRRDCQIHLRDPDGSVFHADFKPAQRSCPR